MFRNPITGIAVCCAFAASGPRRRRTAEQRYEVAPFQLTELHTLSPSDFRGSIADWRGSVRCLLQCGILVGLMSAAGQKPRPSQPRHVSFRQQAADIGPREQGSAEQRGCLSMRALNPLPVIPGAERERADPGIHSHRMLS